MLGKIEKSIDLVQTSEDASDIGSVLNPRRHSGTRVSANPESRDSGSTRRRVSRNDAVDLASQTYFTNERDGFRCNANASTLSLARG
jgi:hypothetical protein